MCYLTSSTYPCSSNINGPMTGSNGLGVAHICREWSQVYAYIEENQRGSVWGEYKTEMQS
ncbi:hypothetical protein CY34DRAFT_813140 [Suillus luteus UH-Slu-Lm8-n1]|uniref:Uncharacterized protein n=1 Tax=Suillus luteus UH-Slu-Lm8-n1 TaxID=930992 RepID=A0A0C9Z9C8_9AGAM|nr:hypothetical protein CY34DRAFT_813140 [Suillus luteus UH-Slu-Lm8-n1]